MFKLKITEFTEQFAQTNFAKDNTINIEISVFLGGFGARVRLWQGESILDAPIKLAKPLDNKTDPNDKRTPEECHRHFYESQAEGGEDVAEEISTILKREGFDVDFKRQS